MQLMNKVRLYIQLKLSYMQCSSYSTLLHLLLRFLLMLLMLLTLLMLLLAGLAGVGAAAAAPASASDAAAADAAADAAVFVSSVYRVSVSAAVVCLFKQYLSVSVSILSLAHNRGRTNIKINKKRK